MREVFVAKRSEFPEGARRIVVSGDLEIGVFRRNGAFYAYRNLCAGCGESQEGGSLKGAELGCPGCGRRYDVRRAGRCLDDPQLHLEPIPLLVSEEGLVKIAQPSVVS